MATGTNGELLRLSGKRSPYRGDIGVVREGALADLLLVPALCRTSAWREVATDLLWLLPAAPAFRHKHNHCRARPLRKQFRASRQPDL